MKCDNFRKSRKKRNATQFAYTEWPNLVFFWQAQIIQQLLIDMHKSPCLA